MTNEVGQNGRRAMAIKIHHTRGTSIVPAAAVSYRVGGSVSTAISLYSPTG